MGTMTMPIKIWSIQIIFVLFQLFWCQYVFGFTTPDPFKKDVKVEDTKPKVKNTNSTKGSILNSVGGADNATPLSTAAESVITFVSVFIVGCVITLAVYSWKRFKPSKGWGMPVPYQYSALRTFDNDPDEDVIDPENNLNMMVDDSTSEDEEIVDSAPATLPVSIEQNFANLGRKRSGSTHLMEDSDGN